MTVDVFELAILLILTLLLGVLIPVLFEIGRTARLARRRLEDTGPKVDRLIEDAQVSARELKIVTRALSTREGDLVRIRESVTRAAETFEKVEKGLRTGSAIGAAIAPALTAFIASMQEGAAGPHPHEHPASHDYEHQPLNTTTYPEH